MNEPVTYILPQQMNHTVKSTNTNFELVINLYLEFWAIFHMYGKGCCGCNIDIQQVVLHLICYLLQHKTLTLMIIACNHIFVTLRKSKNNENLSGILNILSYDYGQGYYSCGIDF